MSLVITLSQIFSPSPIWKNKFPFWQVILTGPYPFLALSPFFPYRVGENGSGSKILVFMLLMSGTVFETISCHSSVCQEFSRVDLRSARSL